MQLGKLLGFKAQTAIYQAAREQIQADARHKKAEMKKARHKAELLRAGFKNPKV